MTFQRNRKRELVRLGHRMVIAGLGAFALTLCCGVMLVLDITLSRVPAIVGAGALLLTTAVLWIGIPMRLRRPSQADSTLPDPRGPTVRNLSDARPRGMSRRPGREVAGRLGTET